MTKKELKDFNETLSLITIGIPNYSIVKLSDKLAEFSPQLDVLMEEFLGCKPGMCDYEYKEKWQNQALVKEFKRWLNRKLKPRKK